MAHYAFLDENNIVTEVIVGKNEGEEGVDWEAHYGAFRGQTCKRTSYNTQGGVHSGGGTPYRKNYAGIGYTFDAARDAFIPPNPLRHGYSTKIHACGMRLLPYLEMQVQVSHLKDTHGTKILLTG
jgi:hypothetical protein